VDQFPNIATALAALPPAGGTVITPPGYTETFGTITIPNHAQLILGRGTNLISNNTNTLNWAITGGTGSSLLCEGSGIGYSDAGSGCTVAGNGSFVGQGLYTNAASCEYCTVQGISFRPANITTPTDVFQTATVYVNQMFTNSALKDNNISSGCTSAGPCNAGANGSYALRIDASNAVLFENNNIGGLCLGTPLYLEGDNNQSLEFVGGAIQFSGYAQNVERIDGLAGNNTHDINHFGVHYEQCQTGSSSLGGNAVTADAISVKDAQNVSFHGVQVSVGGGTLACLLGTATCAAVEIVQSSLTNNISLCGLLLQSTGAGTKAALHNQIRSTDNIGDQSLPCPGYVYSTTSIELGSPLTVTGGNFSVTGGSFQIGANSNSSLTQVQRATASGCATAGSVGAHCTTTVSWTNAFADTNYSVSCNGVVITSGVPVSGGMTATATGSVTFQTVAATASAAQYTNIVCEGFHP
jgi:hypothetical protein